MQNLPKLVIPRQQFAFWFTLFGVWIFNLEENRHRAGQKHYGTYSMLLCTALITPYGRHVTVDSEVTLAATGRCPRHLVPENQLSRSHMANPHFVRMNLVRYIRIELNCTVQCKTVFNLGRALITEINLPYIKSNVALSNHNLHESH